VWTDNYLDIFSGNTAEPHVICVLLKQAAATWAKAARRVAGIGDQRRKLINNGILHIARIGAFLWRRRDDFNQSIAELQADIGTLQANPASLDPMFNKALNRLDALINANPEFQNDVDGALKASLLETAITRSLHNTAKTPAL
jgi:hypothetical protein